MSTVKWAFAESHVGLDTPLAVKANTVSGWPLDDGQVERGPEWSPSDRSPEDWT